MNLKFWVDEKSLESFVEFNINEFKGPGDYKNALALISIIAADYELDPEMDQDTIDELIAKTKEYAKECFTFSFHEEGIEVDI